MGLICKISGHNWSGGRCLRCGVLHTKNYHAGADWSCSEWVPVGSCQEKCAVCGRVRSTEHDWDGCRCRRCGLTRDEGHMWQYIKGSCTEKCLICGKERVAHDFQPSGNHAQVESCSRCGDTRVRCSRCGAAEWNQLNDRLDPDTMEYTDCIQCKKCGAVSFDRYLKQNVRG